MSTRAFWKIWQERGLWSVPLAPITVFAIHRSRLRWIPNYIISARTFAVPEIVEDGRTGLLLDLLDSTAVASAMQWMLERPVEYEQMRKAAWEKARVQYPKSKFEERVCITVSRCRGAIGEERCFNTEGNDWRAETFVSADNIADVGLFDVYEAWICGPAIHKSANAGGRQGERTPTRAQNSSSVRACTERFAV
jgi:hypothetical protein